MWSLEQLHGDAWKGATTDNAFRFPELETAIVDYQTPEKVDSIMKIQSTLAETKDVLVRCYLSGSVKMLSHLAATCLVCGACNVTLMASAVCYLIPTRGTL